MFIRNTENIEDFDVYLMYDDHDDTNGYCK